MDYFSLEDHVVIITGGGGLLGRQHASAVLEAGGIPVLLELSEKTLNDALEELSEQFPGTVILGLQADITRREALLEVRENVLREFGHIDGLINNAANNPKMEAPSDNMAAIQFENFPLEIWNQDLAVGLTGALLCSQVFGEAMAERGKGVILNISSDLGLIAPDQRIYRKEGLSEKQQSIKPVTYSVVKHGLIGLTRYLATYYAEKGVRSNALCPAGVFNGQEEDFVKKLTNLVPMGRMADRDEYRGTIIYLLSEASRYMTGSVVVVDGGRTCW